MHPEFGFAARPGYHPALPVSHPIRRLFKIALPAVLGLLCQCAAPQGPSDIPPPAPLESARWKHVTATLAAAVPTDDRDEMVAWRFSIRKAAGVNARSWPDGRVEVTSGTLTFVTNEAELAAVTAHEMAHVFSRHGRQRAMESWAVILGGAVLGTVIAAQEGDTGTALSVASGAVLTVSLTTLTARQREQEYEADRISLDLLRRAGYPLQAAVDFWERYATQRARHSLGAGGWWKAHPPDAERVRRLRELAAGR